MQAVYEERGVSLASPWGQSIGSQSELDGILRESGSRVVGRNDDPRHLEKVLRLMDLIERAQRSDYHAYLLKEALSTSDFPVLFGDILDRQLLGNYQTWPKIWPQIAKRNTVRDFRQARRIALDGLTGRWSTRIQPELTGVPENDALTETPYTVAVSVYAVAFMISWQMLINDDTGAFQDLAPRLAQGAARSEDYFVTSLFADANGPHASFYTSGNKNIINTSNGASATNPPLSISALQDAYTVLRKQRDPVTGEPIFVDVAVLVVPPALEIIAKNIMYATTLRVGGFTANDVGGGGSEVQQLDTVNWMRDQLRLVVDPYLPIVSSSANGDRAWYLFAEPNRNRPALEFDYLRGYETPSIFMKAPNTMRLGGGVDTTMGDFETLSHRYKAMDIFGGTRLDALMTVSSNGSGS